MIVLLDDPYPGSVHLRDLEMSAATDAEIWSYAAKDDFIIVSKDSDFHSMSLLYGHPPKVIWLRVGNGPTNTAADLLREHYAAVERFYASSEAAFLTLG